MKRKHWFIIIAVVAVAGIAGAIYGYSEFTRTHKDTTKIRPDFKLDAQELIDEFEINEVEANNKYLGKILQVTGSVKSIDEMSDGTIEVVLGDSDDIFSGVSCQLQPEENNKTDQIKIGQNIAVKGICTGYLTEVVLIRCVIENK